MVLIGNPFPGQIVPQTLLVSQLDALSPGVFPLCSPLTRPDQTHQLRVFASFREYFGLLNNGMSDLQNIWDLKRLLDLNWNISKSIEVQQRVKYGDEKLNYYNEDLMTQNDDISWLYLLEYP